MQIRRIRACLLFLVLLTIFLPTLVAADTTTSSGDTVQSSSISDSLSYSISSSGTGTGLLEGFASSDGSFSIAFRPDFTFSKISLQLDLQIKGTATLDPLDVKFDFSDWALPQREDGQTTKEYTLEVLQTYAPLFRSIQFGQRYEPLYIRYGKLMGITLGDGALLNTYFDLSVGTRESRPGLDVMVDGSLFSVPYAGFEFVTNDIFNPTLSAWRAFSRPIYDYTQTPWLSQLEVGISFAQSPNRDEEDDQAALGRTLLALDASLPLLQEDILNLDIFGDIIGQLPDTTTTQPGLAFRYGLWGHTKSFFVFNTSITVPTFGTYFANYFASDFESRTPDELDDLQIDLGTTHLDGMFAFNLTSQGLYVSTRLQSNHTQNDFHDFSFVANVRIDKPFMQIVSLDLRYEKLYPSSTGEGFFEGLQTFKNVVFTTSTVIKVKPYSFDIGLNVQFDEYAEPSFTLDTTVSISIL